jgi:hypothetical protein
MRPEHLERCRVRRVLADQLHDARISNRQFPRRDDFSRFVFRKAPPVSQAYRGGGSGRRWPAAAAAARRSTYRTP